MTKVHVPITPAVLAWALEESGYSLEEVADKLAVPIATLAAWRTDGSDSFPTLTQLKELATLLKRTPATFLLPKPPAMVRPVASFRNRGTDRNTANPQERRYLRQAARLQRTASWLVSELNAEGHTVPAVPADSSARPFAEELRNELVAVYPALDATGPEVPQPLTPSQAFRTWRMAVEDVSGVFVFLFSMGEDGVAGFSLWDDRAPVIAINTHSNYQARSFTLFHEYGHLLTRTSSMCVETAGSAIAPPQDPTERWCEHFAASVLLPWDRLSEFLQRTGYGAGRLVTDLDVPKQIAARFNVSWRAATIRLIEHGLASWDLYRKIPSRTDAKRKGGRSEGVRDRAVIREDQYGHRTINLFLEAADRNVLSRIDVLDHLDVPDTALERLYPHP